jgi:hypothetical protein
VTSAKIADGTITADDLGTNSVGADELNADEVAREVGTALLADPTVVADFSDELANLESNASNLLGDFASNSNEVAQGQMAAALGNNLGVFGGVGDGSAVTSGCVTVLDIANGSVVSEDLADNAVTSRTIADGAVTSRTIADGAVTNRTIAKGAVTSYSIADYSIQSEGIADGAITERTLRSSLRSRLDLVDSGVRTANKGVPMAFAMANGMNARLDANVVGRFSVSGSGNNTWGAGAGLAFEG